MTELCELAVKYKTDKCVFYTPYYDRLLKDRRNTVKKVLEFGIGGPEDITGSLARVGMTPQGNGPSLYMWRDYFPNAEIYALDYIPQKFVNEGRIHSFYCDQGDLSSYQKAIKHIGGDFDLIVEDGSHQGHHQIMSVQMLMPLLKPDGIYVMEDTGDGPHDGILDSISKYDYVVKHFRRDDLPNDRASVVIIRHKQ